jgi:CRP-like cAMP-binding protein
LFAELADEELGHLAEMVRESSCRSGQVVVRQGEPTGDLFSVIRGRLKVFSVNDEGRETMLSVMNAGDVFGEIALFDQEPRSATVVAAEPCRLLVLPRAAFRALLCQMPSLALRFLAMMARQVRRLSERTEDTSAMDVRGRLGKTLLGFADRFGVPIKDDVLRITLKLSQRELGRLIGATREMVNKCLREWVADRAIKCVGGAVTQIDTTRLRSAITRHAEKDGRRTPGRRTRARARVTKPKGGPRR